MISACSYSCEMRGEAVFLPFWLGRLGLFSQLTAGEPQELAACFVFTWTPIIEWQIPNTNTCCGDNGHMWKQLQISIAAVRRYIKTAGYFINTGVKYFELTTFLYSSSYNYYWLLLYAYNSNFSFAIDFRLMVLDLPWETKVCSSAGPRSYSLQCMRLATWYVTY